MFWRLCHNDWPDINVSARQQLLLNTFGALIANLGVQPRLAGSSRGEGD
jgi:hypothetical protein